MQHRLHRIIQFYFFMMFCNLDLIWALDLEFLQTARNLSIWNPDGYSFSVIWRWNAFSKLAISATPHLLRRSVEPENKQ